MANAGWYNDKSDPTLARWHDGAGWTEHVLLKADWEGRGEPPPPVVWEPEPWDPTPLAGPSRFRMAVGSAAVAAVLVIAGVALAQDGGDDPSNGSPTSGKSGSSDRLDDDVADDFGDGTTIDPASIVPIFGDESGTGTSGSGGTSGSTRTTARGAAGSSAVERTETRTNTRTNTQPVSEVNGEDKTSVGNSDNKDIKTKVTSPPSTAATTPPSTTPPDTTPSDTTPTTAAPGT